MKLFLLRYMLVSGLEKRNIIPLEGSRVKKMKHYFVKLLL